MSAAPEPISQPAQTNSPVELLRRYVKWFLYKGVCGGNPHRYLALRAATAHRLATIGLYESQFLKSLPRFAPAGSLAIDIGASFGVYTARLADAVGPTGRVIAFEPLPDVFALLEERFRAHQNIRCIEAAVSGQSAEALELRLPLLFGEIVEPALATAGQTEFSSKALLVRAVTVDNYETELDGLSFIKVDIEGHEPEFFRGAARTIEKFRPVIQFEENYMGDRGPFYRDLEHRLGYTLGRLSDHGLEPFRADGPTVEINFYLVPNERRELLIRG